MTVHINGSKGKELYYNGVKIKEAYYNGNKVYSSGLPIWVFSNGSFECFIVGEYSKSYCYRAYPYPFYYELVGINGALGSSGSTIAIKDPGASGSANYSYSGEYIFNGNTVFLYHQISNICFVLQGSIIGSPVALGRYIGGNISSFTSNSFIYNNSTFTLEQGYPKSWTINGVS